MSPYVVFGSIHSEYVEFIIPKCVDEMPIFSVCEGEIFPLFLPNVEGNIFKFILSVMSGF